MTHYQRNLRASLALAAALWLCPFAGAADTDGDGLEDNADNCTMVANADQRDTDADGYGNVCDADFNNDGITNAGDLGILRVNFFSANPDTDMDGNGTTNVVDLGMLKQMFFESPGPTGNHPDILACNCYFSGDCNDGFCDWGPGGFTVEDNCWWRLPKPDGIPGAGCDTEYSGGPGPICDGTCRAFRSGSSIGIEHAEVVIESVGHWANALIAPSALGGGPVGAQSVSQALALPYQADTAAMEIGRHVADLLSMASDFGFYEYFCHYENYPDEPGAFVDIQADECRINSAQLAVSALQAELQVAGSGAGYIEQIASACDTETWQGLFAPRCKAGPDALTCFAQVVREMGVFLSTPRQVAAGSDEDFLQRLRAVQ